VVCHYCGKRSFLVSPSRATMALFIDAPWVEIRRFLDGKSA
jgi:hypothetical protein